jgi:hypothetical protein
VENFTTAMPATLSGYTPTNTRLRTSWLTRAEAVCPSMRNESVRIQPQNDAVPSLVDGRGAGTGVSNHDATATSGPPRGEPR